MRRKLLSDRYFLHRSFLISGQLGFLGKRVKVASAELRHLETSTPLDLTMATTYTTRQAQIDGDHGALAQAL
jgi:hypothetical protein